MRHRAISSLLLLGSLAAAAQTDGGYDSFRKSLHDDYDSFLSEAKNDYTSFRRKINSEYAAFLADSNWVPAKPAPPVPKERQRDNSLPPRDVPFNPAAPIPDNTPLDIDRIIEPQPIPQQPGPGQPIGYKARPGEMTQRRITLHGTEFAVEWPRGMSLSVPSPTPASIGKAWQQLTDAHSLDATIGALLRHRGDRHLCDWTYFNLVRTLADDAFGKESAENALFTAYVMNQSGYATRLAFDSQSRRLYAMPGTENLIFDQPYFPVGEVKFYPMSKLGSVQIINADYPGARPLSMSVSRLPLLEERPSAGRTLACVHIPAVETHYTCNENLMDFFSSYPASARPDNTRTKWAYYAMTPLSEPVQQAIYPVLRNAIKGKNQQLAADILMDYCESIPYAYDNEVWGYDRAFFPDESLYYLKGDCEDHAILFVRLVRDLMGLDTALLYFPNHLAAAVCFTEDVPGAFIDYDNRKWTVCDPTIFYSGVGHLMNGCDTSKAALIPLADIR